MARMVYTEGFLEDASYVYSPRVQENLASALAAIEAFPRIGSQSIPTSIKERFGDGVLKVVVKPFDLVYEYLEEADTVVVYGLVPFRAAR